MHDFVDLGFIAVLVATQADLLGKEWLGRTIDEGFLKDLAAYNKNITPCGEAGEFHSLVINGPIFKKRLQIKETDSVKKDNHWYLDIKECDLMDKDSGL
jgi:uncharacterized protein (TIGR00290 family)